MGSNRGLFWLISLALLMTLIFVSADTSIARADGEWSKVGELPAGFPLHSLLMGSDGSMYAGSWEKGGGPFGMGEGKVFKSTDNGQTWSDTGSLTGSIVVFPLAESPTTGSVFAGTFSFNKSVFKTTDGGVTWEEKKPGSTGVVYSLLATSDGDLYAGAYSGGEIFKSEDDGETWTKVASLNPTGDGHGRPFALLEASDGSIYAGVGAGSKGWIYASPDNGITWDGPISLEGSNNVGCLLEDSEGNLYAGTRLGETAPPPYDGGVFKSADSGASWNQIGGTLYGGVSGLVEASDGDIYATTAAGDGGRIYKSEDGGESWTSVFEVSGDGAGFGPIIEADGCLYAGANSAQDPSLGTSTGEVYKAQPPQDSNLILNIDSTEGGSVTSPGEGSLTYERGAVVDLVAEPEDGYHFVNWTGDVGTIADVDAASTFIIMNDDYSITANFEEITRPVQTPPVAGGEAYLANKLGILAPWLGLIGTIGIGAAIAVKRRNAHS